MSLIPATSFTPLMEEPLDLYYGKPMSLSRYQEIKQHLYLICFDHEYVGYVMLYPYQHYHVLEEIEIFLRFRGSGYASKVVELCKRKYSSLLIADIQPSAVKFWIKVMGYNYWYLILQDYSRYSHILRYTEDVLTFLNAYILHECSSRCIPDCTAIESV